MMLRNDIPTQAKRVLGSNGRVRMSLYSQEQIRVHLLRIHKQLHICRADSNDIGQRYHGGVQKMHANLEKGRDHSQTALNRQPMRKTAGCSTRKARRKTPSRATDETQRHKPFTHSRITLLVSCAAPTTHSHSVSGTKSSRNLYSHSISCGHRALTQRTQRARKFTDRSTTIKRRLHRWVTRYWCT
jgi:hypothetical protein